MLITGERADITLRLLDSFGMLDYWKELIRSMMVDFKYRCVIKITIHLRK